MSSTKTFQSSNFDLNSLFNITYNFDILKQAIEFIINNQKLQNEKIVSIEEKLSLNDNSEIDSPKSKSNDENKLSNYLPKNDEKNSDNIINSKEENSTQKEHIKSRVSLNIYKDKNQINDFIETQNQFVKNQFEIQFNEIRELNRKYEELNRNMDDIISKVEDFNFFDMFKTKNSNADKSQDSGEFGKIFQVFEKKISKKFELLAETQKKKDEDFTKVKYDIIFLKSLTEKMEKFNNQNQENVNNQTIALNQSKIDFKKELELIDINFNEKITVLNELINKTNEKIVLNVPKEEKSEIIDQKENLLLLNEFSKEVNKKIQDIQKSIKLINSNNNFENLKLDINRINEELLKKSNLSSISELKDYFYQANSQIEFIKEQLIILFEDKKIVDEISWIRKRVDTLSLNIINLKENGQENININNTNNTNKFIDTSKFVELNAFNDQIKIQAKETDNLKYSINSIIIEIERLKENLATKSNEKDLKFLEEYILNRIEDLKNSSTKKFADKNETAKNIKYLNTELKHIIDVYIKKNEKGDNWLIAKKPLEGFKCGSCETYIGDLHEKNNNYIPWNKIQHKKENSDKNYNVSQILIKVGNGFSRMVQIFNIDTAINKKNNIEYQTSNDFNVNQEMDNSNTLQNATSTLPKITKLQKPVLTSNETKNNYSFDGSDENNEVLNIITDPHQPKVVKIYKKTKKNSEI